MSRLYTLAGALALVAVLTCAAVQAADEKAPSIKDIMTKAHKGKGSLKAVITNDIKSGNWEDAAKTAKEWKKLSDALAKSTPKKGEPDSWKMKTETYSKTLTTLVKATEDKDKSKANGALGKIGSSCGTCHKAHK
jgi:cytochrome c556